MKTIQVVRGKGKLSQEIEIGRHRLIADVPPDLGGEDLGPSPHEYLAAALGACTAITLQMYAQRKGWSLEDAQVRVDIAHEQEVSIFKREIRLVGASLDDSQKARLLDIANHCPVHKTLAGQIQVLTSLISSS